MPKWRYTYRAGPAGIELPEATIIIDAPNKDEADQSAYDSLNEFVYGFDIDYVDDGELIRDDEGQAGK